MIILALTKHEATRLQIILTDTLANKALGPEDEQILRHVGIMCNAPDVEPIDWAKTQAHR